MEQQAQTQAPEERLDTHDVHQQFIDGLASLEPDTSQKPRVVRSAEAIGQQMPEGEISYNDLHNLFRQNGYDNGVLFARDYSSYLREQHQTQMTFVTKLEEIPAITTDEEEIFI